MREILPDLATERAGDYIRVFAVFVVLAVLLLRKVGHSTQKRIEITPTLCAGLCPRQGTGATAREDGTSVQESFRAGNPGGTTLAPAYLRSI